ncbi:MAG: ATP-binding protein [bacterium]
MMSSVGILIIDDSETKRKGLILGLQNSGYNNVTGVSSGEEAIKLVEDNPQKYSIIIIDHILAEDKLDGIETTKKIVEMSSEIFPIIFTNLPTDDLEILKYYKLKAYEVGAFRYLYQHDITDDVNKIQDFVKEIAELSELRNKVQEFYNSERNVPSLLTQLDISVVLYDREFKVWYMNPAALKYQKLNGFPLQVCSKVFCGFNELPPCRGCIVQQTFLDGKPKEKIVLHPFVSFDDELRYLKTWTLPIYGEDKNKPIAVLESAQDITYTYTLKGMKLKDRLDIIAYAISERRFGIDRVRIFKADETGNFIDLISTCGYANNHEIKLEIKYYLSIPDAINYCQENGEGKYFEEQNHSDILTNEVMKKFILWPIMKGNRLLGLLSINCLEENERYFDEDIVQILKPYADEIIDVLLQESNIFGEATVDRINKIDAKLVQSQNPNDAIKIILTNVLELTNSSATHIRLKEDETIKLFPIFLGDYGNVALKEYSLLNNLVPSVRVILFGQPEICNDVDSDLREWLFKKELPEITRNVLNKYKSFMFIPLFYFNNCIGSLGLYSEKKDFYNEEKKEFVLKMGERLAATLHDYIVTESERQYTNVKESMILTISHNFQTYLTRIKLVAENAKINYDFFTKEQISLKLDTIIDNVNNLSALTNQILKINKLENGLINAKLELINLNKYHIEIMNEFLENPDNQKYNKRLTYQSEIQNDQLFILEKRILREILEIILSNSFKYSSSDSQVYLNVKQGNNKLIYSIIDEGIGIPNEDMDKIFRPFFRALNAIGFPGTGLGLSIVKNYLKLLGGDINIESVENKGTTVTIEFPFSKEA